MYQAKTVSEFLRLGDDAIFELEEMACCVEEELDDELIDLAPHCNEMARYLKKWHGT